MEENIIRIIPFTKEKEKWSIWPGKFIARSGIKGYNVLPEGHMKSWMKIAKKKTRELQPH